VDSKSSWNRSPGTSSKGLKSHYPLDLKDLNLSRCLWDIFSQHHTNKYKKANS